MSIRIERKGGPDSDYKKVVVELFQDPVSGYYYFGARYDDDPRIKKLSKREMDRIMKNEY